MLQTVKNTREFILEYLQGLDNSETVQAHNTYCQNQNNSDDEIFNNNEDFFETYFSGKVMDAVRAISYGEYQYSHDFVKFNGYANLESFDNPSDYIDLDAIAEDMQENPADYDIELQDVFLLEENQTYYEGTEEEAREQWDEYKGEQMEDEDSDNEILSFEDWVKENLREAD